MQKLNFKNVKIINPSKSDIGPYIYNTLIVDKNVTQKDALFDIYKAVRLGEVPSSNEIAKSFFDNLFFNDTRYNLSDVGRMKMNHRLGLDVSNQSLYLTANDVEHTI